MLSLFKSAAVKELEQLVFNMQQNLENNYKDAAQQARVRFGERLEELHELGALSDKEYRRFSVLYTEYTMKMTGYHH